MVPRRLGYATQAWTIDSLRFRVLKPALSQLTPQTSISRLDAYHPYWLETPGKTKARVSGPCSVLLVGVASELRWRLYECAALPTELFRRSREFYGVGWGRVNAGVLVGVVVSRWEAGCRAAGRACGSNRLVGPTCSNPTPQQRQGSQCGPCRSVNQGTASVTSAFSELLRRRRQRLVAYRGHNPVYVVGLA